MIEETTKQWIKDRLVDSEFFKACQDMGIIKDLKKKED